MADRIAVTSLIRSRITVQKVAGKNGHRATVFARFGLFDRRAQVNLRNLLRSDTPLLLAQGDVSAADWRNRDSCGGGADEWHVDLRKPKGGNDMGEAGLSWDDGVWQPSHHRQG